MIASKVFLRNILFEMYIYCLFILLIVVLMKIFCVLNQKMEKEKFVLFAIFVDELPGFGTSLKYLHDFKIVLYQNGY